MTMASLTGWILIVASLACLYCFKGGRRVTKISAVDADESCFVPNGENGSWCNALEQLTDSEVFFFDGALRLIGTGSKNIAAGTHMIDVFPGDDAAKFIAGASVAKKQGLSTWTYGEGGSQQNAKAVRIFGDHIIVGISKNLFLDLSSRGLTAGSN